MSTYEDYNTTCSSYDDNRQPIGADVVVGMIQVHSGKQLKDIHILDAGCGTGNYAKALLSYGVGKVTLMDASPGMLEQAKRKLSDSIADKTVADVVESKLPKIPFQDGSFDAVLFSLVLHHLNPGTGTNGVKEFEELEQAIAQANRVLRQNGILIIIAQSEDDIYNAWYCQINKEITQKYVKQFASVPQYLKMFGRTGFKCVQRVRLLGTLLAGHFNLDGPLLKAWRDCDSYWAFANASELTDVKHKLQKLKEEGELENWVDKHDRAFADGVVTMLICKCETA